MKKIGFQKEKLAIEGGAPLRKKPLPPRRLFDRSELKSVAAVFQNSWNSRVDFGYQGKFEELYTKAFVGFQGGKGYADAVSSGSAALFVSLAALKIARGSEIIFSPVTDPGGISPALFLGLKPVVADSLPNSFNISPSEFEKAVTRKTKVAAITHLAGIPVDMDPICRIARRKGIKIIEDCSQAHGALYKNKRVGCFGDISFFSTMFSKIHASGGCGGLIYTQDKELYWRVRSLADRGKPFQKKDANMKDPGSFLCGALNFNQDEISCAIGLSTLKKLDRTINERLKIVHNINSQLKNCRVVKPVEIPRFAKPSPFFLTVKVDCDKLKVSKLKFAEAIRAEGIWINPDYRYVVCEWGWMKPYLTKDMKTPNASQFRDETFNILFNERFTDKDIRDVIRCILKVESVYAK